MEFMKFKIGDKVKIKTYKEVIKEYPEEFWNKKFFELNGNRTVKVKNVNSKKDIITCDIISPTTNEIRNHPLDIEIIKFVQKIKLPDKLFKL